MRRTAAATSVVMRGDPSAANPAKERPQDQRYSDARHQHENMSDPRWSQRTTCAFDDELLEIATVVPDRPVWVDGQAVPDPWSLGDSSSDSLPDPKQVCQFPA